MTVRLAHITLERPSRIWRLRLGPHATGTATELVTSSGSAGTSATRTMNSA
ncbi:hypothetical protein [Curtobacterium flaccumfaciens]|uniref:hypothetical protein n=1 Tax=Curtobacterium flaccumfaciens TaxID=2035 RepID=UPI0039956761